MIIAKKIFRIDYILIIGKVISKLQHIAPSTLISLILEWTVFFYFRKILKCNICINSPSFIVTFFLNWIIKPKFFFIYIKLPKVTTKEVMATPSCFAAYILILLIIGIQATQIFKESLLLYSSSKLKDQRNISIEKQLIRFIMQH